MVLMGTYLANALNPTGLGSKVIDVQSISSVCIVLPWVFPIVWFVAKLFDGFIDIPLSSITDNFKSKIGKRKAI